MGSFIYSLVAFVVAIGLLVAVHEYGHYLAARMVGVRVLRYSIGFGRPLWLRRWGPDQTEYCISAIPLGGYVKLLDEREGDVKSGELHRAFNRNPVSSRVFILVAGPLFNFVFAVMAYWVMFLSGVPGIKPMVGDVTADSPADLAGVRSGDLIRRVGDQEVGTWESAIIAMLDELLADGTIRIDAERSGETVTARIDVAGRESELTEPGQLFNGLGFRPWEPVIPAIVDEVTAGGSADRAGLQPGDRVLTADGQAIRDWEAWVNYVRARPGGRVQVDVTRDDQVVTLWLDVDAVEEDGETIGRIGTSVRLEGDPLEGMRAEQRYGPVKSAGEAVGKTWEMSILTVRMVARMITGDVSVKNISGPINIAQYAGYSARVGLSAFLGFLAIVSISLGILNLLPIPILDGGQILYQLAEAIKGGPLSEKTQVVGQQVGLFLLLLVMSFAFYNDIARLLE